MLTILFKLSSIIMSLIGISFIIVFHELGHFIFCKFFGVYTPTFSIGMGKVIFSKKIGDTNFCLSAAPIGGYVEIASESKGNIKGFNTTPYYQKFLIVLGGIFFNFLLTYIIFAGLFFTGMPDSGSLPYDIHNPIITKVSETSVNQQNLLTGDEIISANQILLNKSMQPLKKEIRETVIAKKTSLPATILRNKEIKNIELNLVLQEKPSTISHVLQVDFERKPALSFLSSCKAAYTTTMFYLQAIMKGLKQTFAERNAKDFVGPIMAIAASSKSAEKGLSHLLFLLAIISINLGFMNFLPLPIFDGGQFVIFTVEAILGRELSEKARNIIGTSSWILALSLLVIFTLKDLKNLFF